VEQWQKSAHAEEVNSVACAVCHGQKHNTMNDVAETMMPKADTCRTCHEEQWGQFSSGKHARAWEAAKAFPDYHWEPMAAGRGLQGCISCHGIGLQSNRADQDQAAAIEGSKKTACAHCHSSHTFSKEEAAHLTACRSCHMGSEHQHWESYLSSAHGHQYLKHADRDLQAVEPYPVCQTCHMNQGEHGVMTAWGGLGLRGPNTLDDQDWGEDQIALLRFLGLLGVDGQPTQRMQLFQQLGVINPSGTEGQKLRARMLRTCLGCHEAMFVRQRMESAEDIARQADQITASAIRTGLPRALSPGQGPKGPGLDFFALADSKSLIEQDVFTMFRKHRKSAWRGAFHMSPEWAYWKGLHQLRRDAVRISASSGCAE